MTTPSRTQQLVDGAADLQRQADKLRSDRTQLSAQIAKAPSDPKLIDAVLELNAELTRVTVVQESLETALAQAREAERLAALAAAVASVADKKALIVKRSAARTRLAEAMQAAADALVESIAAYRKAGEGMRADTAAVVRAHYDPRIEHHAYVSALNFALPAADGTDQFIAEAVCGAARRAVIALGSTHTDSWLVTNTFQAPQLGFVEAARKAHENLALRIKDLDRRTAL